MLEVVGEGFRRVTVGATAVADSSIDAVETFKPVSVGSEEGELRAEAVEENEVVAERDGKPDDGLARIETLALPDPVAALLLLDDGLGLDTVACEELVVDGEYVCVSDGLREAVEEGEAQAVAVTELDETRERVLQVLPLAARL